MGNSHNEIRGFMGNLPIPSHNPLWEGIHGKFPKALMGISHEIWVNLLENFLDDARPPPTDPLGDASRRRSACPIAWRGRATSRKVNSHQ